MKKNDFTREYLENYIKATELVFLETLKKYDDNSYCNITPSLDIGFPHDVERIAGGFPTGIYVQWNSSIPFIPVDTTVNVCTSSVFKLSSNANLLQITKESIEKSILKLDNSSYSINFHRGNHFIILAINKIGEKFLLIHSSAAEFKKQFNGLYPIPGNWYMDYIKTHYTNGRYLRYLTGDKALLFLKLAHQLKSYNKVRHEFFAETLLSSSGISINNALHHHHYDMPTSQSVLIGSILAQENDIIPIFTRPGKPIVLFQVAKSHLKFEINKLKLKL